MPARPGRAGPASRRPAFRRRRRRADPDLPQPAGRRPHEDVQRRRLRGRNVRQRHPLRGQVRLRPRHCAASRTLRIETGRGVLAVDLEVADGRVRAACGSTWASRSSTAELIPTTLPGNPPWSTPPTEPLAGGTLARHLRFDGQPALRHLRRQAQRRLGAGQSARRWRAIAHFPKRVNAEFVEVVSPAEVRMRVWERGSGETLACGTGACAVCVAGALAGRTERKSWPTSPAATWNCTGPTTTTST